MLSLARGLRLSREAQFPSMLEPPPSMPPPGGTIKGSTTLLRSPHPTTKRSASARTDAFFTAFVTDSSRHRRLVRRTRESSARLR